MRCGRVEEGVGLGQDLGILGRITILHPVELPAIVGELQIEDTALRSARLAPHQLGVVREDQDGLQ